MVYNREALANEFSADDMLCLYFWFFLNRNGNPTLTYLNMLRGGGSGACPEGAVGGGGARGGPGLNGTRRGGIDDGVAPEGGERGVVPHALHRPGV